MLLLHSYNTEYRYPIINAIDLKFNKRNDLLFEILFSQYIIYIANLSEASVVK